MSKHITLKRIPPGLEWQIGVIWWGYTAFRKVKCECCMGIGQVNWVLESGGLRGEGQRKRIDCPICEGEGKFQPFVEVPKGIGYQIWGTYNKDTGVDEHHFFPISPEFQSDFDLAEWMAKKFTINDDELGSEQTWHEAIQEDNVEVIYGLYKPTHDHFEDF